MDFDGAEEVVGLAADFNVMGGDCVAMMTILEGFDLEGGIK